MEQDRQATVQDVAVQDATVQDVTGQDSSQEKPVTAREGEEKGGKKKERRRSLTTAILSLSLLTVMAGAAVAPVLNVLQEHFVDVSQTLIQMIVSVPALFIVITNLFFPILSRRFKSRNLLLVGLLLYTVGGCIAGVFSHIYPILIARALVGIGVGIIMPMSTGLIAFYYTRDKQERLMGYSSAMNQLGGTVATLLSGLLAVVSWRASFLVYLMGCISIVLCMRQLPNERIGHPAPRADSKAKRTVVSTNDAQALGSVGKERARQKKKSGSTFARYYSLIIAMLLLTFTFYLYPVNFALETAKMGTIHQGWIAVIMAIMDGCGFLGGLMFTRVKKITGHQARFVAPILFFLGYVVLILSQNLIPVLLGSMVVGFAAGEGIPLIISTATKQAGRSAVSTVLPLISAALYTAQFLSPMLLSLLRGFLGDVTHLPYYTAACCAILLGVWSFTIRDLPPAEEVRQED